MEVNQEILKWLVSCPPGDLNFKSHLQLADEATIRAAIEKLTEQSGSKTALKALEARLRQLLSAMTTTNNHHDGILKMDLATYQAEREEDARRQGEQADRERLIAEAHEIIGRVQANNLMAKFGNVANLVYLKRVKETKLYRDLPMVETWDKFCEYIGLSRRKVDEDLMNLSVFGEDFLATCCQLQVGYRELRQLRQLKYDGDSFQMSDDGKTVIIEGETIALGEDAGAEIEAALEKLLEKNKTLRDRNTRLEKDLKSVLKEETAGLNSEINTYKERVKALERFEPKNMDETRFQAQFDEIHANMSRLASSIRTVMAMENLQDHPGVMARVDGYVEGCNYLNDELRGLWADQCMFENK